MIKTDKKNYITDDDNVFCNLVAKSSFFLSDINCGVTTGKNGVSCYIEFHWIEI